MFLSIPAEQTPLVHPEYRADIDGLRAIAVLSVVIFHAFPDATNGGFVGVDIFFVISGFLISTIIFGSLERNSFSLVKFYMRRINRIFPALLAVLISSLIFGWFVLFADEYKQLGKHIAGGAGFISNIISWTESGYFDNAASTKPLLHLWSLGVEEQFYVVWPLLLVFIWKRSWSLLAITATIAAISFGFNIYELGKNPNSNFFLPTSRFWELMMGSALAYISLHKPRLNERYKNARSIAGFGLLLLSVAFVTTEKAFPGWWALLPTLATFLIISAGPDALPNRKLLSARPLVAVGLISYPLYLWHWPLLSFARILESETPALEIRIGAVVLSLVLAWITYALIERPIRYGRYRKSSAIALLVLMTLVGFAGFNTYERDGLKFRDAEKVTHINTFEYPYKHSCRTLTGSSGDDWCNLGTSDRSNPRVVVIGDSYSNSYSTMFDAYSKINVRAPSYIQFGRGICPSLIDYGPAYCREISSREYDYVKSHSEVEKVVLASEWPAYFHGHSWGSHNETADAFRTALEKTIFSYRSLGKQIVVLLAPPFGSEPRSCVIRSIRLTDNNRCQLSKQFAVANDEDYRGYLIPKLHDENVPYFDPFIYFCDDSRCRVTDGRKIYFTDVTHMSAYGGEFLAINGKDKLDELFTN
jgi:peptidoglycan/LPS O-acetylase OafA/YrhL